MIFLRYTIKKGNQQKMIIRKKTAFAFRENEVYIREDFLLKDKEIIDTFLSIKLTSLMPLQEVLREIEQYLAKQFIRCVFDIDFHTIGRQITEISQEVITNKEIILNDKGNILSLYNIFILGVDAYSYIIREKSKGRNIYGYKKFKLVKDGAMYRFEELENNTDEYKLMGYE